MGQLFSDLVDRCLQPFRAFVSKEIPRSGLGLLPAAKESRHQVFSGSRGTKRSGSARYRLDHADPSRLPHTLQITAESRFFDVEHLPQACRRKFAISHHGHKHVALAGRDPKFPIGVVIDRVEGAIEVPDPHRKASVCNGVGDLLSVRFSQGGHIDVGCIYNSLLFRKSFFDFFRPGCRPT